RCFRSIVTATTCILPCCRSAWSLPPPCSRWTLCSLDCSVSLFCLRSQLLSAWRCVAPGLLPQYLLLLKHVNSATFAACLHQSCEPVSCSWLVSFWERLHFSFSFRARPQRDI